MTGASLWVSQRRRIVAAIAVALAAAALLVFRVPLWGWFAGDSAAPPSGAASEASSSSASPGEIDHYTCSMHPSVRQAGPGKCPICGMTLVPVMKDAHETGVVVIDQARRQLIGVRTDRVVEGPMRATFRAVGQVAYDESTLSDVNLKVRGWITKLYVNETGQHVERGQTLFTMYSPELYNAEQDFLLATRAASEEGARTANTPNRMDALMSAARQRLHLLGLTDVQIEAVTKSGAASEDVAIPSPASGFVIEKNVVEGASVDAGVRLYRIAALNRVWVEAEVYEADLVHVHAGQHATVTLDYLPGRNYEAKVAYVYPYIDGASRTGRVRLEIANRDLELRPGMYARVELAADLGSRLQVPASAIVYTGPRRLAFVDLGSGRLRPTEVQVGTESNGMYEVLSGLSAGDVVATSGIFLIAAEARIRAATKYWESTRDETDAAAAVPAKSAGLPFNPPPASAGLPERAPPRTQSVAPSDGPPAILPSRAPYPTPSGGALLSAPSREPSLAPTADPDDYTCPMHRDVHSLVPGKCPICGMTLERRNKQP